MARSGISCLPSWMWSAASSSTSPIPLTRFPSRPQGDLEGDCLELTDGVEICSSRRKHSRKINSSIDEYFLCCCRLSRMPSLDFFPPAIAPHTLKLVRPLRRSELIFLGRCSSFLVRHRSTLLKAMLISNQHSSVQMAQSIHVQFCLSWQRPGEVRLASVFSEIS